MVPKGWREEALSDICVLITKGATPTTYGYQFVEESFDTIRFIGAYNCSYEGRFKVDSGKWISPAADSMLKRSRLSQGDCVICIVGNTIGSSFIVSQNILPANINQNVSLVRPDIEKLLPQFLHAVIISPFIQQQVNKEASTQAQPSLSLKQIGELRILLPGLSEQKKIAQILSIWDKAIAVMEKLLTNGQRQKKSLMQQLLTGQQRLLDESGVAFSGEWKKGSLALFCKISKGKALNANDLITGNYPVIAGGKSSPYSHYNYTHENVITVSASGAYAGYVSYHKYKIWASDCSVVSAKEGNVVSYFYQLLLSMQGKIYSLQSGGAQPHIYPKDLDSIPLLVPNIEEQQKIAAVLSAADAEISALEKKLACLKQEKKALMQQLLTGKRRVKVDVEEPISA